jgi:hypothetical protein
MATSFQYALLSGKAINSGITDSSFYEGTSGTRGPKIAASGGIASVLGGIFKSDGTIFGSITGREHQIYGLGYNTFTNTGSTVRFRINIEGQQPFSFIADTGIIGTSVGLLLKETASNNIQYGMVVDSLAHVAANTTTLSGLGVANGPETRRKFILGYN